MKNLRIPLRIVLYRQDARWVAHCLEFDLCGDGETREQALDCLWDAIGHQLEESLVDDNPANLFSPADGRYFQMFAAGRDIAIGELRIKRLDGVEVDRFETREYSDGDVLCV